MHAKPYPQALPEPAVSLGIASHCVKTHPYCRTALCPHCTAPHVVQGGIMYIADDGSSVTPLIAVDDTIMHNSTASDSGGCIAVSALATVGDIAFKNVTMTQNTAGSGDGGCIAGEQQAS